MAADVGEESRSFIRKILPLWFRQNSVLSGRYLSWLRPEGAFIFFLFKSGNWYRDLAYRTIGPFVWTMSMSGCSGFTRAQAYLGWAGRANSGSWILVSWFKLSTAVVWIIPARSMPSPNSCAPQVYSSTLLHGFCALAFYCSKWINADEGRLIFWFPPFHLGKRLSFIAMP